MEHGFKRMQRIFTDNAELVIDRVESVVLTVRT